MKPCSLFREMLVRLLLPERMEIATAAVLHYQTIKFLRLEVRIQSRQEGVIEHAKDFPLGLSSEELVPANDRRLVHHFHGEVGIGSSELDEIHAADVAVAQAFQQSEMADTDRGLLGVGQLNGLPPAVAACVAPDVGGSDAVNAVASVATVAAMADGVTALDGARGHCSRCGGRRRRRIRGGGGRGALGNHRQPGSVICVVLFWA